MYVIEDDGRLLQITADGFWSMSEAQAFARELRNCAERIRQKGGKIRAVVNALNAPVQSADVMGVINDVWLDLLVDPSDRVALLVESNLAKLQARRFFKSNHWHAFVSLTAARAWLSA